MARPLTRRLFALPAILALALGLSGCSGADVLNALSSKRGVAITRDLAYGAGPRHKLDIYAPKGPHPDAPVVVFFYGGGWDSGKRAEYAFVGEALARRGYVAAIADYRLYPEVRYPAFLQDSAAAVRWVKDHAAAYGGDANRLFLMGHSAGAYNAVMLAVDPEWLGAVGLDPRRDIRGVIGLAGPYDFLPLHSDELKTIFGPQAQRPLTQPIHYVDGHSPPMWLATDKGDHVVDPGNTTRLAARIRAAGGTAKARYFGGLSHASLIGVLAQPLQFVAPVMREASAFIDGRSRKLGP